jgi:hypothetical protein
MNAYAFLQHRRLAQAGRKKRINGPPPQPSLPAATPSSNSSFEHDLRDARTAEDKSAKSNSVNKSAKVVLGLVALSLESTAAALVFFGAEAC